MNKERKWVYYLLLIFIIVGCFLPLYKVKDVTKYCGIFSIISFIAYTIISYVLFNSKYRKWSVITHVLLIIRFISIWSNIQDTIDIITDPSIRLSYKYGFGFYFLLIGIFGSLVYYIIYRDAKKTNIKKKTKYNYNKITGVIEKVLK